MIPNTEKMGTRSRLQIRRPSKSTIYLWMHWDGYFDGVGVWLCEQVRRLLETYAIPEIQTMLESLDLEETTGYQCFNTDDLIPFIKGETAYKNDPCDDIMYEYILDFSKQTFVGVDVGFGSREDTTLELSFDQIKSGVDFSNADR